MVTSTPRQLAHRTHDLLFRTVHSRNLPSRICHALQFNPGLSQTVHLADRVGTYGSVNLAVVR